MDGMIQQHNNTKKEILQTTIPLNASFIDTTKPVITTSVLTSKDRDNESHMTKNVKMDDAVPGEEKSQGILNSSISEPEQKSTIAVPECVPLLSSPTAPDNESLGAGRWKQLFGQNQTAYIFFKHMRKAAGTSMKSYLQNVVEYHQEQNPKQQIQFYEQEFCAMDSQCPVIDPRWNSTLSITVLRHPIERQLSEIFYSGPVSHHGNLDLYQMFKTKKFLGSNFSSLFRKEVHHWIDSRVNATYLNRGVFMDNFQTRALSTATNTTPQSLEQTNGKPCFYDSRQCKGEGGVRISGQYNVTNEDQESAKKALRAFDFVMVSEFMSDPEQSAFLADVTGMPLEVGKLAGTIMKRTMGGPIQKDRSHFYRNLLQKIAPDILELLEFHSRFEIGLYEYARCLSKQRLEQWKTIRVLNH